MHGDYSRKNQVKAILPVFDKYLPKAKFWYFIIDNVFLNDIYIIEIINLIHLNLDTIKKKLQCIRDIINLIARVFIFANKSGSFKGDIAIAKNTNNLEITMKLWKKQSMIGKFHNLIWFIWNLF